MNAAISITELYDILSSKIGKEEAKTLTQYISVEIENKTAASEKIITKDIQNLQQHIDDRFATKDDIISLQKWMIGIFITIMLAVLGLYFRG